MPVDARDIRIAALISIALTIIAIILACVGVGTPSWLVAYSDAPNNTQIFSTSSLYYYCVISPSNCTNSAYATDSLYYLHLRQASGLAIVGILFLFFGALGTLKIALGATDSLTTIKDIRHREFHLFTGPLCLLIASIIMLAALAEGSRIIILNGYAANLYQTAHVISIFGLLASAYASGVQSLVPHYPFAS